MKTVQNVALYRRSHQCWPTPESWHLWHVSKWKDGAVLIVDAHLDLAMNTVVWNRGLELSAHQIRELESGTTAKGRAHHADDYICLRFKGALLQPLHVPPLGNRKENQARRDRHDVDGSETRPRPSTDSTRGRRNHHRHRPL